MHMIKLVVGSATIDEFSAYQDRNLINFEGQKANGVITRQFPKRAEDILKNNGSMYRVIKNVIQFHQRIIGFKKFEHPEKGRMCLIACAPDIIRTRPTPRRPFQGWRYLEPENAPADLMSYNNDQNINDSTLLNDLHAAGLL